MSVSVHTHSWGAKVLELLLFKYFKRLHFSSIVYLDVFVES